MKKWIGILAVVLFAEGVTAQNTIVTDTILQLSTCAGGNVLVPFTATGTYPTGNVFTAQLSNAFGQFTNPINIGTVPFNLGFILATIPQNTNFGFFYKIRVVSSNPAVIGTPCPNSLIITQVAELNQIIASPNDTACIGDTITLTAINPANTYAWSTGETTASIQVTQTGVYSVTTVDFLMCETDTSKAVVFENCTIGLEEMNVSSTFQVVPNPNNGSFVLTDLSEVKESFDLKIVNVMGQTVFERKNLNAENSATLDLRIEEKGIYYIHIQEGPKRSIQKVIVQ